MRRLIFFLLLATAGCAEDFAPYNRLTSLRVLAIRSKPPAPGPGETATLDALVYTPDGAAVTHTWRWCPVPGPANEGYPCLVTDEQLRAMAGGASVPSLDLGAAPTASFTHGFDPALLQQLCARSAGQGEGLLNCKGGFPIQIRLTVTAGGDTVEAVTQLRLRFDPADEPNTNPELAEIAAMIEGAAQPIGAVVRPSGQSPPPDPIVTLLRDADTKMTVTPVGEPAETYLGWNDMDQRVPERERLQLTWFVETGDTKSERTSFNAQRGPIAPALENEWTPAKKKDDARDTARIIVVIRDNRGGVGWREGAVLLEDAQ